MDLIFLSDNSGKDDNIHPLLKIKELIISFNNRIY